MSVDKTKNLPKGWAETLAEMYSEGASDTEIRAELKITKSLWDSMYTDAMSSMFQEVVDFGRMLSNAWWLKHGRKQLFNKQFNSPLWLMNMKNRFGWSDRTESQTKSVVGMDSEELDMYIRRGIDKANRSSAKG